MREIEKRVNYKMISAAERTGSITFRRTITFRGVDNVDWSVRAVYQVNRNVITANWGAVTGTVAYHTTAPPHPSTIDLSPPTPSQQTICAPIALTQ